jgi:pimeloyl-ACP methyl ester carboxylesterase
MKYLASCTFALTLLLWDSPFCAAAETFDSKGVKISYSVHGKGTPVILIHGFLSSGGLNWDAPGVTGLLAKNYQVITLDVRGHGASDKPTKDEAYGLELVEDVVRLMDHLKISKAHVVGYSMGGIITAKLMAKHPDRVLSGTLGGMGWLNKVVGDIGFGALAKNADDAKGVCFRNLSKLALTQEEIKSIKVPVTVIVGDRDNLIKKLYVEPLKPVRTDWPVVEIKGGDHITTILQPQFKEEIDKWLAKQSKR